MSCPKEISSARYYEPQGYKEFYTEETDGISLLFPGLNTAGLSKANIPPPVDNNIASTHEFSSPRAANNFPAQVVVKLSGQTYFCSDISHLWPDKHR